MAPTAKTNLSPAGTPAVSVSKSVAAMSASGIFTADSLTPDSTGFPPTYEAALLYSANYFDSAEQVLKKYLQTSDGKNSIRAWLMIFDLYQLTHNRQEFDALSMPFTVKFERSAPNWLESGDNPDPRRKEKRERKDLFVVAPSIDGAILSEIDRFEALARQMGSARLDFGKVKSVLVEEAELFAIVLLRIRKEKIPVWFNGLDDFVSHLKNGINDKTGQPVEVSQGYWSLLFELCILDGRLQEYEELGLEYAVAFEMSPPAWETVSRPTGSADNARNISPAAPDANATGGFMLNGVIGLVSKDMLQQLTIYASSKPEVAVDMSRLLRIDFAAVSLFFETIRAIHLSQKKVVLSNLNELVAALLEVFGIAKIAIVMRKKSA